MHPSQDVRKRPTNKENHKEKAEIYEIIKNYIILKRIISQPTLVYAMNMKLKSM